MYKPAKCIIPRAGGARHNWGLSTGCVICSINPLIRWTRCRRCSHSTHPFILYSYCARGDLDPPGTADIVEGGSVRHWHCWVPSSTPPPPVDCVRPSSVVRRLSSVARPRRTRTEMRAELPSLAYFLFFIFLAAEAGLHSPASGGRLADSPLDGF